MATLVDNQGWPEIAIEEIADVNPRVDKASIPDDLPVSFVPMPAVGAADGTIHVEETRPASKVKKGFTAFLEGDVLFAKITPCMENGKMAVVPALVNGYGFGSTEFHVLRPKPGMDAKYLYYYVSSQSFRREAERHMTGAVGQRRVPTTYLKECKIPVAPLDQQKRIVAEIEKQFSRLDEAVANLKRVKANLKRYKAAVLKAAVSGRLVETEAELARREGRSYETGGQLLQRILETRRSQWKGKGKYKEPAAPDTTDLPELPEGWVWASLDELSDVVRGGSPRPAGDPRYFGGPVPWITVGPLTADESDYLHRVPEGLTFEGKERSRYIEPDTLLLTNSGATLGVPKISLIGGCINDGVAALLGVGYPLKRYLVNFLRTKTMTLRRINQGAAQPNLNTSIIKAMIVPLPPEAEQHQIVAEVDLRLSLLRETEAQVDANFRRAERMRQSILSRAFSGELINESTFLYTTAAASAI
ncbi:restriction endonuclease subunit S [Achromobacter sp.]|uniref:restriction endonuclease subunit S n=1 Tax=Achromobacter sp. TaxID=134375 RepID=UPI0025897FD3|nr:restriction endonuclease subunit S [Achromobacter sp.]